MKKYKVAKVKGERYRSTDELKKEKLQWAEDLKAKYELPHSLDEVLETWSNYSEDYFAAGWLIDSKEDVERAFNLELEEVNDGE